MNQLIHETQDSEFRARELADRNKKVEEDEECRGNETVRQDKEQYEDPHEEQYDEQSTSELCRQKREKKTFVQKLGERLDQLYEGRRLLPKRKIGTTTDVKEWIRCVFRGTKGRHYSDYCPEIQNGNGRWDYVKQRKLC
ncbi:unnamed protein product [Nippostrongylus brasiliensis]|uniref:Retrotrans_gag domain-containing protein n=1 Tax=Nippostrongylus brasiliensis TaxID=27835 RepID=A0A0N4Y4J2_NIPBR|nr:unnamed protein product [Nippostrongylus brasiliensis]